MKGIEVSHALKSLSKDNVGCFKRDMRQKQWLIACIKGYLVLLENNSKQLEVTKCGASVRSDNDENTSPIFSLKRVLSKIMSKLQIAR